MTDQKIAVIAGIRGVAGHRKWEGLCPESLPDVRGNCNNCDALIKAIPDWERELGYY